jgi:hypothetical protein
VVNSATRPLFVRDLDAPVRQPFHFQLGCINQSGSCLDTLELAPGKVAVIEFLAGRLTVDVGQAPEVDFTVLPPSGVHTYPVPLALQAIGAVDTYAFSYPTRLYAEPESTLRVDDNITPAGQGRVTLVISGHFVDCGPGPGCSLP